MIALLVLVVTVVLVKVWAHGTANLFLGLVERKSATLAAIDKLGPERLTAEATKLFADARRVFVDSANRS